MLQSEGQRGCNTLLVNNIEKTLSQVAAVHICWWHIYGSWWSFGKKWT